MLGTPRARGNGLAFVVGWTVGLAVVGTLALLLAAGAGAAGEGEPASWVGVLKLALGALLVLLAARQWRQRARDGREGELPDWMRAIDGFNPREPLLDYRLVQFAATLPPALRIKAGQGKWLMKKALEPYLPHDILYRPKMGFVTPISAWFRKALADEAAGLARSKVLAGTGWFDVTTIEKLAADHKAGRAEHGRTLWQLLMLERSLTRLFG